MDYRELIELCTAHLGPGEWVPVLCSDHDFGKPLVVYELKTQDAREAQIETIQHANRSKDCYATYVVHRHEDDRASVHMPGWVDVTGEWYAGWSYKTPLYESARAWDWETDAETFAAPRPRLRPSGLAERIGLDAMERRAPPCRASMVVL